MKKILASLIENLNNYFGAIEVFINRKKLVEKDVEV